MRIWLGAVAVLCLSAAPAYGTESPGAWGVSEGEQKTEEQKRCYRENGLPENGPVRPGTTDVPMPWADVPDTWQERKKWLAKNRDENGRDCRIDYAMPHCVLLSKDWVSWLVQAVLVVIGVGSLVLKKRREDRLAVKAKLVPRPTKVWALDVSKQAFSSACAHMIGMVNASILQNRVENHAGTSECSWYLIAFTLDTTCGVLLGYLMIRLCTYVGQKFPWVSALRETGNYRSEEREIDYWIWGQQLFVWCIITVVARVAVLGIMILAKTPLTAVSSVVAQEFACSPRELLWLVMLAGPVTMNVIQLWVQDQFLKNKLTGEQPEQSAAGLDTFPPQHTGGGLPSHVQTLNRTAGMDEPLLSGRGQARADMEATPAAEPYVDVTAKELRKHCCGWVLNLLAAMFVVVPLLMFTGVLASEQYYYDHCYTQVQIEAFNKTPFTRLSPHRPYTAEDWSPVPSCKVENAVAGGVDETTRQHIDKTTLRYQTEHRWELSERVDAYSRVPKCRCCNKRVEDFRYISNTTGQYTKEGHCKMNEQHTGWDCPGVGECCGRSTVIDPDPALQQACSVCDVYLPCDKKRCAARPDYIRNAQHYPLALGVTFSLLSNFYILYTWTFNPNLRRPTITSLISLAAAIELVYCVALLMQEVSFRIPNAPCEPETHQSSGGLDVVFGDCEEVVSQWHGWPTWENVHKENRFEEQYRHGHEDNRRDGQRGQAVNYCQPMSFLFQLTWTASDSVYFMITVDLFLNLVTSPFGGTSKRWIFYHGWTWSISFLFAGLLMYSGDWGVSQESVLEDFCWNVNFGHHSLLRNPTSNMPSLQIAVYTVSGGYYAVSLIIAAYAQWIIRRNNLPEGLKEARLESIKIGTVVTSLCAGWLLSVGLLYFYVMSTIDNSTVAQLNTLDLGLRDYPTSEPSTKTWVMVWAFVWGARNVINLIVWRYVIAQYSSEHAEITFVPEHFSFRVRAPPAQVRAMIQRIIEAEISQAPRLSFARPMQTPEAIEQKRQYLEKLSRDKPDELSALAKRLGVQEPASLELNEVLRNELLFFAGLGIRSALRYPYHEHVERATLRTRATVRSSRRKAWNSPHEELQDDGDIDDVSVNLADAERWEKEGGESGGPTEFSKEVEDVFTATHTRASKHFDTGLEQELTESEKDRHARANYDRIKHLEKFRFKTYEPKKFRRLRELFGIDIRGGQGEDSELHKSMESFQVTDFTGGASGAFMYFSADKRFIIKEINQKEMNRMLKMLNGYIKHLEESREGNGPPRSLLQRVVQCNRITMSDQKCCGIRSGRLYFMVVENCLYPRIIRQISKLYRDETQRELNDDSTKQLPAKEKAALLKKLELNDHANQRFFVYDLKGSRHGRSTLLDNGPREQQMRNTMKDNDLRENVHLSTRDRDVVLKFLEKDSKFLEQQQVMDYSLLLGIQKGIRQTPTAPNRTSFGGAGSNFEQFAQAAALDGAETFYFGIIDFLQEWDKKKQAEAKAKALIYGWDDISAVKPDLYQKRFVYRLGQYFPPESTLEIDHASPEPEPASFMSRCVSCDTLSTHAQRAEPLLRALQTALTA